MLSFVTGDPELSRAVVEATKMFAITVSFGSVNSTISLPNYMSHASIPASLRQLKSIPADLVRISVGAEDVEDLLDDLGQAFEIGSRLNVSAKALAARIRTEVNYISRKPFQAAHWQYELGFSPYQLAAVLLSARCAGVVPVVLHRAVWFELRLGEVPGRGELPRRRTRSIGRAVGVIGRRAGRTGR